jgi:hypothetical protein
MLVIGGKSCWKEYADDKKAWIASFHWIARQGEDEEPSVVLRPARWRGRNPPGCAPYCLQLTQAGVLMERSGYAGIALAEAVKRCFLVTNTPFDRAAGATLGNFILGKVLPDLINMPPREAFKDDILEAQSPTLGEMTLQVNGEVVASRDVKAIEVGD